jgi:hypothetical protein
MFIRKKKKSTVFSSFTPIRHPKFHKKVFFLLRGKKKKYMKLFLRTITGESFDSSANSNFTEDSKIEDLKQYLQPFFSKSSLNFCFKGRIIASSEDKTSLKDLGIKEGCLLVIAGRRLYNNNNNTTSTNTNLQQQQQQYFTAEQISASSSQPTPSKPIITPPLHSSLQNLSPPTLLPALPNVNNSNNNTLSERIRSSSNSFPSDPPPQAPTAAAAENSEQNRQQQQQVNLDQLASSLSERRLSRSQNQNNNNQQQRSAHELLRSSRSNSDNDDNHKNDNEEEQTTVVAQSLPQTTTAQQQRQVEEEVPVPPPEIPVRPAAEVTVPATNILRNNNSTVTTATNSDVPESSIAQVLAMGFSDRDQIIAALRRSRNNVEAAIDILLS